MSELTLRCFIISCAALVSSCARHVDSADVQFTNGGVSLSGTLFFPSGPGPSPAVVIVHGSGSQTRASYIPLAKKFARHGIAALAYDKRGTGASSGDWQCSPFDALAADAAAAVEYLRSRKQLDPSRVGIWGGSEGGWIAPWVASNDGAIAFVIVQSAPVVGAARQHLYQTERLMMSRGASKDEIVRALDYTRMQHRYAATGEGWTEYERMRAANRATSLAVLGGPVAPNDWWWTWWRTKMAFDPTAAWSQVKAPVLAMWGANDDVVPVAESRAALAAALARASNQRVELRVVEGADHNLDPHGAARALMIVTRLLRGEPGTTPSMKVMTEWAASQTGVR